MDGNRLGIGAIVWRIDPDGGVRRGEVVGRDPGRRVFNVAWLNQAGGVFHVPEAALDGGTWGLGEPTWTEPIAHYPPLPTDEERAA